MYIDEQGVAIAEVYVVVFLPRLGRKEVSSIHRFDLCQGGKCIKGGFTPTCSCGVLEPCTIPSEEIIDVNKFYTKEVEVTDVIGHQRWSFLKPFDGQDDQ